MTLPSDSRRPAATRVRPADRLGFTLFLAALIHLALILGVGFTMVEPANQQTMEITLATFKSEKRPRRPTSRPRKTSKAAAPWTRKRSPRPPRWRRSRTTRSTRSPRRRPPSRVATTPKAAVTTVAPKPQKPSPSRRKQATAKPAVAAPTFDSSQLSSQIASLEAELANEQQLYAKRPRIHRLSAASTMRDKGAWYKEEWRKKVERIGNLNYPDEARRQQIYGSLRLMVSINRDGSLYEVLVLESSGQPVLDQAAQRIVRLAAPFAPFTGDLADLTGWKSSAPGGLPVGTDCRATDTKPL
jgi:protein TonB